jgi:hypothetical protein
MDVDDGLPKLGARTDEGVRTVPRGAEYPVPEQVLASKIDLLNASDSALPGVCAKCGNGFERDFVGMRHGGCGGSIVQAWVDTPLPFEPLPIQGIPASIGVDTPITWRPDYLGQPREGSHEAAGAAGLVPGGGDVGGAVPSGGGLVDEDPVADPAARLIVSEPLWGDQTPPFTYLAGPAGCGKTFAVQDWQRREKGLLLLATTGIAALNLGGTTINATLGYFDTKSLQESYTNGFLSARLGRLWRAGIKRLVLDEVSMLEGDALTYIVKGIEEVNGRGYVIGKWTDDDDAEPPAMGITLVGDFAQLPPVNGTFAWESPEWGRFAEPGHTITLTEIRRQSEQPFIQMLRAARVGDGKTVLAYFRSHGGIHSETDDQFDGPTLFAKNQPVDRYNWIRLGRLIGRDLYFESRREGEQRSEWGNPKKEPVTWGIPLRLHVKIGALVMILANKRFEGPPPQAFEYVNGDLGTIVEADEFSCWVQLKRNAEVVQVAYCRREVTIPCDAARRKELRDLHKDHLISENGKFEITGWIEYMPLRVGYASTVHKSQGLSLDAVQVNIRDAFFKSPGMMYVALSRARSGKGLRLVGSEAAVLERCVADPRLKAWL